ncbi:diguanylate cyclase [Pseudomonas citronellolis]|uniref:diguanylate cyclase n=1 Tax=Pseudomonas citronellolis TaxID=53408 RepID=UPI0023E3EFBD|nr:diguanylate cyclase [Pseudomonas citronellolis]MDF3935406.1 sensor domain-containing diguanylate cyclase [Pseudomonas citronellolis]
MLLLWPLAQVWAQPLALDEASSGSSLNDAVVLLEDRGQHLDLDQVRAHDDDFQPANGRTSVGQSPNPWWLRLDLERRATPEGGWWLEVDAVNLQQLSLYLPDGHGGYRELRSGEAEPFAEGRDRTYRRPVFRLPEGTGPLRLYLRAQDPAGNSFPLRIWSLDGLQDHRAETNLFLGVVYGLIAALLLYNLFILVSLRDRAYLWYVLTTGFALLFSMGMTGHAFEYLWPGDAVPWWLNRITLPSLWGLCVTRFTQTLLQTRRNVPWAHHMLTLNCSIYVASVLLNAFVGRYEAGLVLAVTTLVGVPAALGAAVTRSLQGSFPARLYLVGFGLVLSSVSISVMRALGVVQPSPTTAYLFPVSVAMESILFSFALTSRIQELKREKALAQEQAIREKSARMTLLQSAQTDLAQAVAARTAELTESNQLLLEREAQLRHAAHYDPLTGLPNRRYLVEHAEQALQHAQQHAESLALMLIDLDHFKPINDTYGHDAGDFMLQHVGHRLRQCVRSSDCVSRLGGDEFAALIAGPDAEGHAREIAVRLLSELSRPVQFEQLELRITPSIGVAIYPRHALQFAKLYKAADQALYEVKGSGRASYALAGDDEGDSWLETLKASDRLV